MDLWWYLIAKKLHVSANSGHLQAITILLKQYHIYIAYIARWCRDLITVTRYSQTIINLSIFVSCLISLRFPILYVGAGGGGVGGAQIFQNLIPTSIFWTWAVRHSASSIRVTNTHQAPRHRTALGFVRLGMGSVGGALRLHSATFMNLCSVFFMSRCGSRTVGFRVTYRPPAVTHSCCTPPVPLHCTVPLAWSFHESHLTPCGCHFSMSRSKCGDTRETWNVHSINL